MSKIEDAIWEKKSPETDLNMQNRRYVFYSVVATTGIFLLGSMFINYQDMQNKHELAILECPVKQAK